MITRVGELPTYDPLTGERLYLSIHSDGSVIIEWVDKDGEVTFAKLIKTMDELHKAIRAFGFNPPPRKER